eukprot:2542554-Pyramimonas_sp.AAC.1
MRMRSADARALERHAGVFSNEGCWPARGAQGTRTQGCPWEGCPPSLCGLTAHRAWGGGMYRSR